MKIRLGMLIAIGVISEAAIEEFNPFREAGENKFELKHYDLVLEQFEQIPEAERTDRDRSYLAWSHYFLYTPEEAVKGFRKNLKKHPDSIDDLCGAGWALHDMGYPVLAAVLFRNALAISPAYEPAVCGYTASSGKTIKAHRSYGSVRYYGTLLNYSGETPRTHGVVHDLQVTYGLTGLGYLYLNITRSDIDTEDGLDPYRQTEIRPGFGIYAGGVLWRGTAGNLSFDELDGGTGTAWLGGIGVEYLNGKVNPLVDAYGFRSDRAKVTQIVPGLAYGLGAIQLRSSLEVGHYELDLSDDEYGAYFQQTALWQATPKQSLFAGIGGGESYYGLRGAGSVFYSLPDKRLADAWLQWGINLNPWTLSLGASYAHFEDATANPYDSFGATFSLTWRHDGLPD